MARKDGRDRGVVEKPIGSGKWWVRLVHLGREKWYRTNTKSQAKALYGRLKADAREGKFFPQEKAVSPILLRDYFVAWLKNQPAHGKKPVTIKTYEWRLRKHVLPVFGSSPLSTITRVQLKTWSATLLDKGLDFDTALNILLTFSAVLSEAVEDGLIHRIPPCDPARS